MTFTKKFKLFIFNSSRIILAGSIISFFSIYGCSVINFGSDDSTTDDENSENDINNSKKVEDSEEDEGFGSDFGEMELLAEALRSYDAERYSVARSMLEKLVRKYPASPLTVFAELKIADATFYAGKQAESIPFYKEFIQIHTSNPGRPYAMYQIGQAQLATFQGIGQDETPVREAKKAFERLRKEYPEPNQTWSNFALEQISECDKLLLKSELEIIAFYLKTGQELAAKERLRKSRTSFNHIKDSAKIISDRFPDLDIENELILKSETTIDIPDIKSDQTNDKQESLAVDNIESIPSATKDSITELNHDSDESLAKALVRDKNITYDNNDPIEVNQHQINIKPEPPTIASLPSSGNKNDPIKIKISSPEQFSENNTDIAKTASTFNQTKNENIQLSSNPVVSNGQPEHHESIETIAKKLESDSPSQTIASLENKAQFNEKTLDNKLSGLDTNSNVNNNDLVQSEKSYLDKTAPSIFLNNYSCASNEDQSRLVLVFNSKPFIKTAVTEIINENNTVNNKNLIIGSHLSTVIIQNVFSTAPVDVLPIKTTLPKGWMLGKSADCRSILDEIQILEIIKISEQDSEKKPNPDVFVIVKVVSKRSVKINTSAVPDPERLIITFRGN
ncbi:MAG TPA: outer membrane protein assembly factor BamD [Oligoflexia bacterium]|nr:outer membrane protein assembly factor BamD [Oligoflexia bacterium]HMP47923.1 outer membrane protein assembly factor BamD [Oligoflexia bacterium]